MASSAGRAPTTRVPAIIVHGGAGADSSQAPEFRQGVRAAVLAGWRVLAEGGTALDAVENAVRALEDDPRFNAGRGSVLNRDGAVEMDASIMEGDRLQCGAVAALVGVANPVTVARRVLDSRRHVLLVGDGALAFARSVGIPECDPASLVTDRQRKRHAELARKPIPPGGGTVGAVALDRNGTTAAATSTGGTPGKLPGRVGDSALIGCGTYADSSLGGVSCTGDGEAIIRVVLAHRALRYLKDADDPDYAAKVAVDLLVEQGGLILIDWRGRPGYATSTRLMPVAIMSPTLAEPEVPF
jgi:beta-aspartyl-peptidase (threonine type)